MEENTQKKRAISPGAMALIWLGIFLLNMILGLVIHAYGVYNVPGDYDPLALADCPDGKVLNRTSFLKYNGQDMVTAYVIGTSDGQEKLLFVEQLCGFNNLLRGMNRYQVLSSDVDVITDESPERFYVRLAQNRGYVEVEIMPSHYIHEVGSTQIEGERWGLAVYFTFGLALTLVELFIFVQIRKRRKKASA